MPFWKPKSQKLTHSPVISHFWQGANLGQKVGLRFAKKKKKLFLFLAKFYPIAKISRHLKVPKKQRLLFLFLWKFL